MKYILIVFLVLLLAVFLLLLVMNSLQGNKNEETGSEKKPDRKKERKQTGEAGSPVGAANVQSQDKRRLCFESYQQYQREEHKYRLYRAVFCEYRVFHYLQELFGFQKNSAQKHLNAAEYRKAVLDGILTPMRNAVERAFPMSGEQYTEQNDYHIFLTPEEYYEQQLAYFRNSRNDAPNQQPGSSPASEEAFWENRLEQNAAKLVKLRSEPGNVFFHALWEWCRPVLEEAEITYRERLLTAPTRSAGDQLTKELTERLEEALYRAGICVQWYQKSMSEEDRKAFVIRTGTPETPALLRERDGLVYEKGSHAGG